MVGSGDELCGLLSALCQAAAHLLPTVSLSAFPGSVQWKFTWRSALWSCPLLQGNGSLAVYFSRLVYWKFVQSSALCLSPIPWCSQGTPPLLLNVPFQFLVYYSVLFCFFLWGGSQSVQGAMLVYPKVSCRNTVYHLFAHLLVCISQQVCSWYLAVQKPSCFLSIMWCGEALYGLGRFRASEFCFFFLFFFCQVWLQHLSNIFDLWSSRFLLPPSSHLLGFPQTSFKSLWSVNCYNGFTNHV
jgi:hypothetical protein